MRHDQWSRMGEEHLGEHNVAWAERVGPMILMKSIINDYWADNGKTFDWSAEHVNMVMSKLYWCWVRWLENEHPEEDDA